MWIKVPKSWEIPEREATAESVYWNRRDLLKAAGFLGVEGLLAAAVDSKHPYPAKRNPEFEKSDRPITEEWAATGYPTRPYNGYEKYVAEMYTGKEF